MGKKSVKRWEKMTEKMNAFLQKHTRGRPIFCRNFIRLYREIRQSVQNWSDNCKEV